jgi:hypothetical protein
LVVTVTMAGLSFSGCSPGGASPDSSNGLGPFRELALAAGCSDFRNRLHVIDDEMVLWDRRGDCPDNGYALVLYGATPEDVLCYLGDSIAGPRRSCSDEQAGAIFDIVSESLDAPDLGLGPAHTVTSIDVEGRRHGGET